ncbi:tether containing UBX domain for GLUT4 [Ostrinia nubilalis]|uniref:tether containing UBX domain for GLUT4 n=1 Tax=Ostrinia nubilalis TaxID=29057 RepID=UPI0030825082
MSKDIIVLTPNGRRQKIHCTPDTIILQVLEDVCQKQGFQATDYDLKHHNHILDLTTSIRFSNLPNKAMLEMVETERKREETMVTIGLMLEDGERRTADFSPNTSLFELITTLAPTEFKTLRQPTILYMRQEVIGESALRGKTLRQLGLMSGRAILRLLNKAEEAKQANVSAVYRRPVSEKQHSEITKKLETDEAQPNSDEKSYPGPSNVSKDNQAAFNPVKLLKNEKKDKKPETVTIEQPIIPSNQETTTTVDSELNLKQEPSSTFSASTQANLERRLNIEEEVTFLGTQKAIAFMQPEEALEELDDLPDDFYELTIEEVRKLYHDLQQNRLELENTPLVTASKKQALEQQTSQQKLNVYKNVVVRVQFPDHIILQGVFSPTDIIQDVMNFIKSHLMSPDKPFHIYTTPLKETLDPNMTLIDAKFVPCVHMHFKWLDDNENQTYLKEEIYSKKTSSDAASILASKYRAPSRRKIEDGGESSNSSTRGSSNSKNSKVPKWFKK